MTEHETNPSYYTSPVLPAFTKPGDGSPRYLTSNDTDIEEYVTVSFEEFVDSSPVTRDLDFSGVDIPGYSPTPTDLPVVANVDLPVNPEQEEHSINPADSRRDTETEPEVYIHETEYVNENPEFPDLSGLPETVTVRTDVLIGLLLSYIEDNLFDPPRLHEQDITDTLPEAETKPSESSETEATTESDEPHDLDFDGVDIPGASEEPTEPTPDATIEEPAPSPTASAADSSAHETWGTDDGEVAQAGTPPRPDTETPGGSRTKTKSDEQSQPDTTNTTSEPSDDTLYGHNDDDSSVGSLDDISNASIYDDLGVDATHKQSQEVKSFGSRLFAFVFSILGFGKAFGTGLGRLGLGITQKSVLLFEGTAVLLLMLYALNAVIWLFFPAAALPVDVTTYAARLAVFGDLTMRVLITTVGLLLIGVVIDFVTGNNRYETEESPSRL